MKSLKNYTQYKKIQILYKDFVKNHHKLVAIDYFINYIL